jgi:hypothetical protein
VLDDEGVQVCPEHSERQLVPTDLNEARHTYVSLMVTPGSPSSGSASTSATHRRT